MSGVLLISDSLMLFASIKVLIVGIGLIVFAAYVSLSSPERLQRHPRLRKMKDRHIAEFFAAGVAFTAFATVLLVKQWFDSGGEPSGLEMGLMRGFFVVFIVGLIAVFLFRILSNLRD